MISYLRRLLRRPGKVLPQAPPMEPPTSSGALPEPINYGSYQHRSIRDLSKAHKALSDWLSKVEYHKHQTKFYLEENWPIITLELANGQPIAVTFPDKYTPPPCWLELKARKHGLRVFVPNQQHPLGVDIFSNILRELPPEAFKVASSVLGELPESTQVVVFSKASAQDRFWLRAQASDIFSEDVCLDTDIRHEHEFVAIYNSYTLHSTN